MTKIKEDGVIQNESRSLEHKKSRTSEKTSKKSGLVPQTGLEPVQRCRHRILSPAKVVFSGF